MDVIKLAESCGAHVRKFKYQSAISVAFTDDQLNRFVEHLQKENAELNARVNELSDWMRRWP